VLAVAVVPEPQVVLIISAVVVLAVAFM